MARDPWKWLERANRDLIRLRPPPPMPEDGVPDFDVFGTRDALAYFHKTGQIPKVDDQSIGDHFDLLITIRLLRQSLAIYWVKLSKQGKALDRLAALNELHMKALIYTSAIAYSVEELKALNKILAIDDNVLELALSRQCCFLIEHSREIAGLAVEYLNSLLPKGRGRKRKEPFNPNEWQPPEDGPYNQQDFIAWASRCKADFDKIPMRTAIKFVLNVLNEHGEIEIDKDLDSLERAVARHLGAR